MVSTHKFRKKVIDRLPTCAEYPDLLHQSAAVKAAIIKTSELILKDHIEPWLVDAMEEGITDEYVNRLMEAISKLT